MFDSIRYTDQVLRGSFLIKKGEKVKNIFHIKKGCVEVLKAPDNQSEKDNRNNDIFDTLEPVEELQANSTFLEMEALTGGVSPYYFRAKTMGSIARVSIHREELESYLEDHFELTLDLLQHLSHMCATLFRQASHAEMALERVKNAFKNYCTDFFRLIQNLSKEARPPEAENWVQSLIKSALKEEAFSQGQQFLIDKSTNYWQGNYGSIQYKPTAQSGNQNLKTYPQGSQLFREGDPGDAMYILLSGKLEVLMGDQVKFIIDEAGSIVGEIALLMSLNKSEKVRRTAGIRCQTNCQLIVINTFDFIPFMKTRRDILINLIFILKDRYLARQEFLEEASEKIQHFISEKIPGVCASYEKMADAIKENSGRGTLLDATLETTGQKRDKLNSDLKIFSRLYLRH